MEAAQDIFYNIYDDGRRSGIIDDLLRELDFHALSITLLATTASHNKWNFNRLKKEWETRRTQVLRTHFHGSLAATIELSLASPTFRALGPDARELLGVVAFFPQGIDENNLDWLFPTVSDGQRIFDTFCALSLTHRSGDFTNMLAPIRDYLRPQDPKSSPLLCAAKDRYFDRLLVKLDPHDPEFSETKWIVSEDVNVEYLLDVFTSVDEDSDVVWSACTLFMVHLQWYKPRSTVLRLKIEGLPDDHPSKPAGLIALSRLFQRVGNFKEAKRVITHALRILKQRGDEESVAQALTILSDVNWKSDFNEEGIEQAREAAEIFGRLGDVVMQADCLNKLSQLLLDDGQLDAAEEIAIRAIDLLTETEGKLVLCQCHRSLGKIYHKKGKKEEAVRNFEAARVIAFTFGWQLDLFGIHYSLADLFLSEGGFDEATSHIEQAKPHAHNDPYSLALAMEMQATTWYRQRKLDDATSEVLGAMEIYEELGSSEGVGRCRTLLQEIERAKES
jgi:tetratricopeptide (TPR) repeat protein